MNALQTNQNQAVSGFLATAEPQAYQQAVSNYTTPISIAQNLASFGSPQSTAAPSTPGMSPANVAQSAQAASGLYSNALAGANYNNSLYSGLAQGGANLLGGSGGLSSLLGGGASSVAGTAANGGWATSVTPAASSFGSALTSALPFLFA